MAPSRRAREAGMEHAGEAIAPRSQGAAVNREEVLRARQMSLEIQLGLAADDLVSAALNLLDCPGLSDELRAKARQISAMCGELDQALQISEEARRVVAGRS